jgi:Tfp pilus assembly protein PilN
MIKRLQSLPTRPLLIYCAAATACCGLLLAKVLADSQTIKNQAEGIQRQTEQLRILVQSQDSGGGIDYDAEMQKVEKMRKDRSDEYKRQQQIVDRLKK